MAAHEWEFGIFSGPGVKIRQCGCGVHQLKMYALEGGWATWYRARVTDHWVQHIAPCPPKKCEHCDGTGEKA